MKKLYFSIIVTLCISTANAQWMFTGGPCNSDTSCVTVISSLAVSGTNIFALVSGQGLFLSPNNGNSWTSVNNSLAGNNLISLDAYDSTVFVATLDSGLYLTTNNGNSWVQINNGLSAYPQCVAMANCGNRIFVALYDNIYSSSNNGGYWSPASSSGNNIGPDVPMVSLVSSGNYIIAEDNPDHCGDDWYELLFSNDNGNTWNNGFNVYGPHIGLLDDENSSFISMAASGNNVFLSLWQDGFYLSLNGGNSWVALADDLPTVFYPNLFAIDTNIIAGDNNHLLLSGNNGSSWTDISEGLPIPIINVSCQCFSYFQGITAYAVCGDYLFIGTNGSGVWKRPLIEIIPGYVNKYNITNKDSTGPNVFKLYPNPATNLLYIETGNQPITDMKIYNSVGSLMIETKQSLTNGIDISYLPKGVYIAEITLNDVVVNQKWVKM